MKKLLIIPIGLLIFACGGQNEIAAKMTAAQKKVIRELPANDVAPMPEVAINSNLKNGLHARTTILGDTLGYQYYLNGVKHGPYFDYRGEGMKNMGYEAPNDGYCVNGKKHGYFQRYDSNDWVLYTAYYENGEFLWAAWNGWEEMGLYPMKPMHLDDSKEEINIVAPYPNGRTRFKGKFKNGRPVGVHKFYTSEGKKCGEINYYKRTITEIWGDGDDYRDTYSFADDVLWYEEKS